MKPFNVKDFISNEVTPIMTREGIPATIIHTELKGDTPIVYKYPAPNTDEEDILLVDELGRYNEMKETKFDLFFAPKKHKGWVNIVRDNSDETFLDDYLYSCEKSAKEGVSLTGYKCVATIPIEWEE